MSRVPDAKVRINVELVEGPDGWFVEAVTATGEKLLRSRTLLTREAAMVEAERMTAMIETHFGTARRRVGAYEGAFHKRQVPLLGEGWRHA